LVVLAAESFVVQQAFAVSALTVVLSDTFVVSVTTVVLSLVAGVDVLPPPQEVNTAVKMLSATNVTFFMLFVFVLFKNLFTFDKYVVLSFML
jgi:hypothetical protein